MLEAEMPYEELSGTIIGAALRLVLLLNFIAKSLQF
jgi:hypothetical protein